MRPNPAKEKLRRGELAVGMMTLSADPHIVGVIAATGYDFIMFDLEHTSLSYERLERLVHAADAAGVTPVTPGSRGPRGRLPPGLGRGGGGGVVAHVGTGPGAAGAAPEAPVPPRGERGGF